MHKVEPTVFFLGETTIKYEKTNGLGGVEAWLDYIGGPEAVACLDHVQGADLEKLIELLARRCYKSFAPGLNPNVAKVRTNSEEFHANILKQRHGSVEAHGHCTYAFEGVSRVFTHEVVRNNTGNDMSQESLRYVRLDDIKFWIPPIIEREKERRNIFLHDSHQVKATTPEEIFMEVILKCEWAQRALADYYDINNIKDFERKKKLTSAFRRVAPEGLATGIGMTFQIRSLRWIIEQRTSSAAEEEIRLAFGKVAEHAMVRWPKVFQDFKKVDTGDGLFAYVPENSKI